MKITRSTLLILFLCTLSIGLVILLGAHLDRATEEEIVAYFSQRQLLLAEQSVAGIQAIFNEAQQYLLHFKDAPGPTHLADALAMDDEEKIATWRGVTGQGFSGCLHTHPIYTHIRYIDASGQEIVVLDSDGETVRVVPQDELRSQAEREFFIAAMQLDEGQTYASPLEPALGHGGVGTGMLTVHLSTPIFDSQGRRAGIIVINLLTDEIRAHVARLTIEEGVDAWVLDETGVEIINVTRPEWEGSDIYEYCRQTGDETLIALTEDMMAGEMGTGIYLWPEDESGPPAKRLMAYAPIHLAEGRLWSLGISSPYENILTAHRQTRQTLLFLGGGIIVIILAGAATTIRSGYKRANSEKQARRAEELESLHEISLALTAQLELDELLRDIVERGCRLLGVEAGGVYLVDEARGDLELFVSYGYGRDYKGTRLAPGEGLSGRVLQSGAPLVVDDYNRWEGRAPDWEAEPMTAALGVPLKRGDQVIGVLNFSAIRRDRSFDEHDLWLAALFASQATVAIENARLLQDTRAHARELAVLNELGQALTTRLDVEQVLDEAHRGASRLMDTANFYIVLDHPDKNEITFALDVINGEIQESYVTRPARQGLAEYIIRSRAPLLIKEHLPQRLEELGIEMLGRPALSWVGAPLIVGERVLGMMAAVQSDETSPAYSEHDRDLLLAVANHTAIALQNAYLFEETERRATQLTLINDIAKQIAAVLDLDSLLERTAHLIQKNFGYHHVALFTLDRERDEVVMRTRAGEFDHLFPPSHRLKMGQGMVGWAARHGQGLLVNDVDAEPRYVNLYPDVLPTRSELSAPITVGGEVWGILDIQSPHLNAFDEGDVMVMETLTAQIAIAIENARLYEAVGQELVERKQAEESLARHNRELALLNHASQAFGSTLDLEQVLSAVLEEARHLLGVTACSIWLVEPGSEELICRHSIGSQSDAVQGWRLAPGEGFAGWVAQSGESLIVPDAQADERYFKGVDQRTGLSLRSILSVPLRAEQKVTGVLQVLDTKIDSFDAADVTLIEPLAASASIAIENARLHLQLLDHAGQLEQRVQERTAQLQAQYARLEAIMGSISDGIIVTSAQGELILANPVAQTWLNQTLSPEDAAQLHETVQDLARRASERPQAVLELTGLDLELKAAPVTEEKSEQQVVVVAAHDVSHLKALDRVKTRFVSNVSHELRTPITTIKLYAALMRKRPEKWDEYLDTLTLEADRQARLVEDILQISRIDTGRLEIHPRPAPLNELTKIAVANRRALAESEGLTLEHHPAEPGPTVLVDPERVMQVLNNLVENAIHYTPEGGKIVVSTGTGETENRIWATATVADTGMGIPEGELPHIFERFFRGEKPQTLQISGTGLGLAIVKEIVELHGGRVIVESEMGAGTTFTIWLPLANRVSQQ